MPNGLKEELSYDAQGRLSQVRVMSGTTELRKEQWTYNGYGEVATHVVNGVTTTYGYDNLGLLLSEVRPGYSASYVYDPNGNRTSRTRTVGAGPAEVDVYAYDQGDKLLHIDRTIQHPNAPVTNRFRTYGYNGLGETPSIVENGATTTFAWNNDGRITGMDLPGTTNDPTFRYNGLGTRIDRTVGANTEVWKRAGAGVTASVLNDGVANLTPGISSRVGSTSTFTHAGLKNTGAQSEFNDNTPAISGTKTYDAFGLETATTGTWKTAFGYAGNFGYQKTDAGMKLLGHRYYDPETGRFLSRDPIKHGRNWYAYGAGTSAASNIADPTGLIAPLLIVAAVLLLSTVPAVAPSPDDVGTPSAHYQGQATQQVSGVVATLIPKLGVAMMILCCMAGGAPPGMGDDDDRPRKGKPTISGMKDALRQAHGEVGQISGMGRTQGKFGSPMRVDGKKGYRLDPPHPNAPPGSPEESWHINWWDWSNGKKGKGGRYGGIPIK